MRQIDLSTRSMKKVAAKSDFFSTVFVVPQISQNTSEWMLPVLLCGKRYTCANPPPAGTPANLSKMTVGLC